MNNISTFFSLKHIRECSFHTSLELTEQAIHCLELVSELAAGNLEFQFKGGNSLLLILDTPSRFSIDVDIATDRSVEEVEAVLFYIVKQYPVFIRWEKRQHKTKPWIPLTSYHLFYHSVVTGDESSIMLDVQLHRSPYVCIKKQICCGALYQSSVHAELPLPSGIIGDKLLTLGPSTLGIPVGKGKEAQRLKHIFDIARLLAMQPRLDALRESFINCLALENKLQNRQFTLEEIIMDTLHCLYLGVSCTELPGDVAEGTILAEHVAGLHPFAAHLFSGKYSWLDCRFDMAQVAYCIAAAGDTEITDQHFAARYSAAPVSGSFLQNDEAKEAALWDYWNAVTSSKYGPPFAKVSEERE